MSSTIGSTGIRESTFQALDELAVLLREVFVEGRATSREGTSENEYLEKSPLFDMRTTVDEAQNRRLIEAYEEAFQGFLSGTLTVDPWSKPTGGDSSQTLKSLSDAVIVRWGDLLGCFVSEPFIVPSSWDSAAMLSRFEEFVAWASSEIVGVGEYPEEEPQLSATLQIHLAMVEALRDDLLIECDDGSYTARDINFLSPYFGALFKNAQSSTEVNTATPATELT